MATALESASLVMAPCGYEDGTLGSLQPTDGSGDFTFTRGSNLSATRVNAAGNIEKGYENLLLQSNSFNTTWTTSNAGVTSGQIGYDGSSDAWLLSKSDAGGQIRQNVTSSGVATFSVYAKANASDYAQLVCGSVYQFFNLSLGTLAAGNGIGASIEAIGTNGWYRCSMSFNSSITTAKIYPAENNNAGATSGSIYIQDAMLNQGLVAYPYIETATTSAQGGILEDTPRIDYSSGPNGSLLLEPSRTNLVNFSEYYGQYPQTRVTITDNYGISPDGSQNAAAVFNTTDNGRHNVSGNYFTVTSGTSYVNSVFAKAGTITKMKLKLYSGGGTSIGFNDGDFDLTNGTATGTGAGIESYGNGWYRCYVVDSPTSSVSNARFNLELLDASGGVSYVGSVTDYIQIFGSQVEQASYPTSYIPTYGTSVTRSADACSKTGISSLIGQTEGTLYSEAVFIEDGTQSHWVSISDGTARNWIFVGKDNNDIRGYVRASNSVIFTNQTFQIVDNAVAKIAVAYKSGDIALYINGTKISSSTNSFSFDNALDRINFGTHNSGATLEKTRQKEVLVFKERLSDAALAELTTL